MSLNREQHRLRTRLPAYKRRVAEAKKIIAKGLRTMRAPYVSCSFGKDSVVLLHLVLQQAPCIPVVFINSNYCFPDTYEVRDRFVQEYDINLVEIKQPHDYMQIISQYGLPDDRTPSQQAKVVQLLKKDVANQWAHDNGCDGHFWGLRKEEAQGRRWLLNTRGPLFWAKAAKLWRCSPLANWTWDDIWAYIFKHDLPYSAIYEKDKFCDPRQIRNTSYITTDGAALNGRVAWLKYYYPDLFSRLEVELPELRQYV
jgi:phosphoadenosine phosphosulfate reductase